jgi:lipoyl(octanoyl) transferase
LETVEIIKSGLTEYSKTWELQKNLLREVTQKRNKHYIILTEHKPVITMGRGGDLKNLLYKPEFLHSKGIQFLEIDRGGDITFHGPGQIVGYPILNLEKFKKDIHWYMRTLEEVIIKTLNHFSIPAERIKGHTGVWINNEKICAIGLKVSRWVTMHGFALNVNVALNYYNYIIPCGIYDRGVTSISEQLKTKMSVEIVNEIVIKNFAKVFRVKLN